MSTHPMTRRAVLGSSAALALIPVRSPASPGEDADTFAFEVQRTEDEWRAVLSEHEFHVLREGGTEQPQSSALWDQTAAGAYCCRGCALSLYDSGWKVSLDKGWAFFKHSECNAVLTSVDDFGVQAYGTDPDAPPALIEAHCRRCGSHLGHILIVGDDLLHCINGTSLTFTPTPA